MAPDSRRSWVDSMPEAYDRHLGPVVFAPFAKDLADRIAGFSPSRVLELAAGTGLVTRELLRTCPGAQVVATDLNPAMVDYGSRQVPAATWRRADAQSLPFPDAGFDLVACQFGIMFFPDKPAAVAEARRVLVPGGRLVFNTWGTLDSHRFGATLMDCLRRAFPADPPKFLNDIPHGYADPARITADVTAGGLVCDSLDTITLTGTADAADVALGFCTGTPVRAEIEARGDLDATTALIKSEMRARLGDGPVTGTMSAHVVVAHRPG
ncbi:MAG TPA: methyltransferase domain-containing protein [Pseudonocardia sp.]|nr:methyltransferase domain-containing protein [Pseudonocardia sp.]